MTMKAFLPNPANREARAECVRFIHKNNTGSYACLIISGPDGSGKTHLLNAAVNLFDTLHPYSQERGYESAYIDGKRFIEEEYFSRAFYGDIDQWLNKLSYVDLLSIDDCSMICREPNSFFALHHLIAKRSTNNLKTILGTSSVDALSANGFVTNLGCKSHSAMAPGSRPPTPSVADSL